jgi:MFS family permease
MRTFLVVWFGQTISIIGSALTSFALYVWVYQTTGSVTQYALVNVFASLAGLLVGPYAGVVVDRHDRRRVMLLSDVGEALISLTILLLAVSGLLRPWQVYLIVGTSTALLSFHGPAFTAATTLLVPRRQFARTAGMRQMSEAASSVLAPLLGGYLLLRIHLQGLVSIDLVTFVFAFATLLMVRIPSPPQSEHSAAPSTSWWRQAGYGWQYLRQRRPLMRLLEYVLCLNFVFSMALVLFTPLVLSFATAAELGRVLALGGVGALAGGLLISLVGGPKKRIWGVISFAFVSSASLAIVAFSRSLPAISVGAFLIAAGLPVINSSAQAIWQAKVAPEVQGRVFAFRRVIGQASMPIAILLAGPLADFCKPLLRTGGALADSAGRLVGVGEGRGIALVYLLLAVATLGIGIWGILSRGLNRLEQEVPDALAKPEGPPGEAGLAVS